MDLHPGERIELPTIALGHGGSVVGIALGRDGAVVPKAQVQAYYSDPRQGNDRPRHAWRNAPAEKDGSFRFEGLKPGQWTVSAMPPSWTTHRQQSQNKQLNAKVQIVEGQTASVTFTIPKGGGCKIHGRITRGGKAVTQGNVGLWRQDRGQDPEEDANNQGFQSQIGANGEYEIEHVSPGKYYFNFNSWSESGSSFGQEITIPNSPELNYDVALPVGGEVRGRVTRKSDGKALSGMSVSAYSMGPSGPGGGYSQSNATTDS